MTIDDIKMLIASDKSRTLELKKTTGGLKVTLGMCSSQCRGGLIFGITIDQEVTNSTQREFTLA
jgi:ATP-dependent DNA helicase RecG